MAAKPFQFCLRQPLHKSLRIAPPTWTPFLNFSRGNEIVFALPLVGRITQHCRSYWYQWADYLY